MSRHRSGSVSVTVDVDIGEVLDDIEDEVLFTECRARGLSTVNNIYDLVLPFLAAPDEFVADLRDAFQSRDRLHFEVLLSRFNPIPVPRRDPETGKVRANA